MLLPLGADRHRAWRRRQGSHAHTSHSLPWHPRRPPPLGTLVSCQPASRGSRKERPRRRRLPPLVLPSDRVLHPHPTNRAGAHAACKADKPDADPVSGCAKCSKDGKKCLECSERFGLTADGTCVRCTVPGYFGDKCSKCDGDKPDICLT